MVRFSIDTPDRLVPIGFDFQTLVFTALPRNMNVQRRGNKKCKNEEGEVTCGSLNTSKVTGVFERGGTTSTGPGSNDLDTSRK